MRQRKVEEEYQFMTSPSHVRHCIDLVRNSLMCLPDLTIEVKDEARGGVTGLGLEHECIDWVGHWETYSILRQEIGRLRQCLRVLRKHAFARPPSGLGP